MKSLYLLINLGTILIPFVFSFHPKLKFNLTFKPFFIANSIVALIFIAWDIGFTEMGIWGFNPDYTMGIKLWNLPIEEVLFFICIPFSCVFTYHCLNQFFTFRWNPTVEKTVVIALSVLLFLIGLFYIQKGYTAATFISLALLLVIFKFIAHVSWLPKLLSIYPVLLIPFFIVNGLLTGSWIEQPVVWYNNDENLGIRLLTIPVEDVFYGFELILLNLYFYNLLIPNQPAHDTGIQNKTA
jgi:lycopene cyclase domain-containing protein